MKRFKLFVSPEQDRDAESWRWVHLTEHVDRFHNEVRIYTVGVDVKEEDLEHPIPYMTVDGKKKSFRNAYKLINHVDEYIPRML